MLHAIVHTRGIHEEILRVRGGEGEGEGGLAPLIGNESVVESCGFGVMVFTFNFKPFPGVDGREECVAVESLADLRDDQALGHGQRLRVDLRAADDAGWCLANEPECGIYRRHRVHPLMLPIRIACNHNVAATG